MEQAITVALIEDDKQIRKLLTLWLRYNFPTFKVIIESGSVNNAVQAISRLKPNLVFLDMKLNDGTGLEVLQALPNHDEEFAHIVLSGHSEFMQDAWQFAPKGYVLKPFDDDKLERAINYALRKISLLEKSSNGKDKILLSNDLSVLSGGLFTIDKDYLLVKTGKKLVRLKPKEDIMYCRAAGDNTSFYLENGKTLIVPEHLRVWEKVLAEFDFIRIHRSYMLNLAFFYAIEHNDKDGTVVLFNGAKLKLSRLYKTLLIERLQSIKPKLGGLSKNEGVLSLKQGFL